MTEDEINLGRFGRFVLPYTMIRNEQAMIRRLMGMMIIVRAQTNAARDAIEYTALGEMFGQCRLDEPIPFYSIAWTDRAWVFHKDAPDA